MRIGSDQLKGVLTGTFDAEWGADVVYDGEVRIQGLPIADVRFQEDGAAKVQQSGSCTVVWSDEFATSITPQFVTDPLAPFGARLHIYVMVTGGGFSERVEYGRFEITDIPAAHDEMMRFRGDWITVGSEVQLELKEITSGLGQERFDVPTSPSSLTSTWDEAGRISGMPLQRTVADQPISRSILYPESKLDALYELADVLLDAIPHITPTGALSARPKTWPAVTDTLRMAEGLVDVGERMTPDGVYNRVVVKATGGDATVLAVAEVTAGPLRVRNPDGTPSPFRARTLFLSSELVTTTSQAMPWATSTLAEKSTLRTRVVPVVETFNPLRERGDVILIERPKVWLLGRVVTIDRSGATQQLTVEISGSTPRVQPVGPFDDGAPPAAVGALYPSTTLYPSLTVYPKG
jgi:hypothetical protein